MAVDIVNAQSASTVIKNGGTTIKVSGNKASNSFQYLDTGIVNKPVIGSIESKYDTRFDDPRYYAGDTAS